MVVLVQRMELMDGLAEGFILATGVLLLSASRDTLCSFSSSISKNLLIPDPLACRDPLLLTLFLSGVILSTA